MANVGGIHYFKVVDNKFVKASKNAPDSIGMFIAGGPAVDKKVALANAKLADLHNVKTLATPKQSGLQQVKNYISSFFK